MAWIIITDGFDWHPTEQSTIAYQAGPMRQSVTESCAGWAIVNGKATRAKTPTRAERQSDGNA